MGLIHDAVKTRRTQNTDPNLDIMWRMADEKLEEVEFFASGRFVGCFSEVEDDLGQWRGYGGGECGYAIGFQAHAFFEALLARPDALLVPMNYEKNTIRSL